MQPADYEDVLNSNIELTNFDIDFMDQNGELYQLN